MLSRPKWLVACSLLAAWAVHCVGDPPGAVPGDPSREAGAATDGAIFDGGSTDVAGGFADCNGNPVDGAETDLLTDPRHCGGCGRTCGSQTCSGGLCVWEEVGPMDTVVSAIAVDDTHVYFGGLSQSGVSRVPKAGGAITTVATTGSVHTLRTSASAGIVLVGSYSGARYSMIPKDGGSVYADPGSLGIGVELGTDALYFMVHDSVGGITRVDDAGAKTLADAGSTFGIVDQLGIDSSTVYWAAKAGVFAADLDLSDVRLVDGAGEPLRVRSQGGLLAILHPSEIAIRNLVTNQATTVVRGLNLSNSGSGYLSTIAFDPTDPASPPTYLYFTEKDRVARVALARPELGAETLAKAQAGTDGVAGATGIAIDGEYVYWGVGVERDGRVEGAVRRVHK